MNDDPRILVGVDISVEEAIAKDMLHLLDLIEEMDKNWCPMNDDPRNLRISLSAASDQLSTLQTGLDSASQQLIILQAGLAQAQQQLSSLGGRVTTLEAKVP